MKPLISALKNLLSDKDSIPRGLVECVTLGDKTLDEILRLNTKKTLSKVVDTIRGRSAYPFKKKFGYHRTYIYEIKQIIEVLEKEHNGKNNS